MGDLSVLLTELADKLGTTTEYLWGVLIKQAQYEVIIYVVNLLVAILSIFITVYFAKKFTEYSEEVGYDTDYLYFVYLSTSITFGTVGFLALISLCVGMSSFISALFNPEFWALQEILNFLQ